MKFWFNKKQPKIHEASLPTESDAVIEINSPTWRFIQEWTSEEIDAARDKNDSRHHNEIDTAFIRGQIAKLKDLVDLPGLDNRPGILNRLNAGEER